jgi:hypothetical protein
LETREHPLRRRYAWQLALGLLVLGAVLFVLLGGEPTSEGAPEPRPAADGARR